MANTFTATSGWRYGGANNKALLLIEGTLVIDTTGGATALDLPKALFGLQKIIDVSTFVLSDNSKIYFGTPDYAGASVMVGEVSSGTPINLPNGTYKVSIRGFN